MRKYPSHAVHIASMWARSIASLGRGLPLLHLTAQLLCHTNISWRVTRSRTKIGVLPGYVTGMRLQPLTCHKSTKSHGGACLEATHVPPLQEAHNAIVATAAFRCAQMVGMTVCMFGLNEAATIPCRAHHTASQSWVILPRVPQVEILTGGKKQSVPADGSPMYPPHETSIPLPT
jgi:hypothetical protein